MPPKRNHRANGSGASSNPSLIQVSPTTIPNENPNAKPTLSAPVESPTQRLVQGSHLITFGPGLKVKSLVLGLDLCTILIRDLPLDATEDEVTKAVFSLHARQLAIDDALFKLMSLKEVDSARDTGTFPTTTRTAGSGTGTAGMVAEFVVRIEEAKVLIAKRIPFRGTTLSLELEPFRCTVDSLTPSNGSDYLTLIVVFNGASSTPLSAPQNASNSNSDSYNSDVVGELREIMEEGRCIPKSFETSSLSGDRVRVAAKFGYRGDLEDVASTLRRGLSGGKITPNPAFQVILPAAFNYSKVIASGPQYHAYQAQKAEWAALEGSVRRTPGLFMRVADRQREKGRSYINVQGSDEKEVGAVKVRAEKLAAGELLGPELWHDGYMNAKKQAALGKEVKAETGVVVSLDRRVNLLRLFGSSGGVDAAKVLIQADVDSLNGEDDGLEKTGSRVRTSKVDGGEEVPCSLCSGLAKSSDSHLLGCGHSFCKCLRQHLRDVTNTSETQFPLLCPARHVSTPCNTPLPVWILEKLLSKERLNRLIDAAFSFQIDANPEQFQPCPTPSCRQVYQRSAIADWRVRQCPSCLFKMCPACGEDGHAGLSCDKATIKRAKDERKMLEEKRKEKERSKKVKVGVQEAPKGELKGKNRLRSKGGWQRQERDFVLES